MLKTKGNSLIAIGGIDEQSIDAIQTVQGAFPYQIGLQQRIPGKVLDRILTGPITSIYVFYLVHGRHYTIIDYGPQTIIEIDVPPIRIPPLPPKFVEWFDDFSGYGPEGLISRVWGAGFGNPFVGIAETFMRGLLDPWELTDSLTPPAPTPPPPDEITPVEDGGSNVPPTPPPSQYEPGDCTDMPDDMVYIDVAIGSIFTSIHQFISVNNYYTGPTGFSSVGFIAWPAYGTPYTDAGVQPFAASRSRARSASSSNFGDAKTDETQVQAIFNLSTRNDPIGTQYWLVGTKTLSNGTMGAFGPNVTTTCAACQFATEGETFGNLQFIAIEGDLAESSPVSPTFNRQGNVGTVNYSIVRIFFPNE